MKKTYQKKHISNSELSLQLENLSLNFSELTRTVSTMHEDLSMNLKMLEVKHINTSNSIKAIKESIKDINHKIGILNIQDSSKTITNSSKERSRDNSYKNRKRKRKKTDDFLFRPKRVSKFPDSPEEAVREFRAITESDIQSNHSKEKYFNNIIPVNLTRRENRTDSFFSKTLKPMELFLDIPKNLNLDCLDESCLKTPKKVEGEIRRREPSDSSSEENSHFLLRKKSHSNINIKNFDDFKMLLKDLKLTLNLSNYSTFNENFEENFNQLEKTLHDYHELDHKIENFYHKFNENQTSFADFLENNSVNEKQTKSVNCMPKKNNGLNKLSQLKKSTNFHLYENKLKELKDNPSEFESFFIKLKKELEMRGKKFEQIKTLFSM